MSQLLELAQPIGLTEDTLELLRVLPLVYVAWADGEIQPEELAVIIESAESFGLSHAASLELLESWLQDRPSDNFFKQGLRLLSYVVASLPDDEAAKAVDDVAALCDSVARAAGGMVGHSVRIDPDEQMALRQVAVRLDLGSRAPSRKALQGILDSARA